VDGLTDRHTYIQTDRLYSLSNGRSRKLNWCGEMRRSELPLSHFSSYWLGPLPDEAQTATILPDNICSQLLRLLLREKLIVVYFWCKIDGQC